MRRLLFIHGVAQGGRDPDDIRREWIDALTIGCAAAGAKWDPDIPIDLPFYGDRLDALIDQAHHGQDKQQRDVALEGFSSDMLLEMHTHHPGLREAVAATELAATHEAERVALNSGLLRSIAEAIDRRSGAESFLVSQFLSEVHFYVQVPQAQREIDAIIDAAITDEETVVVAHSLGTVVSYRALLRHRSANIVQHVTVGSPLACSSIRTELGTLENPCPDAWFNARDPHDFVAFHPLDAEHFGAEPPIRNHNAVVNSTPNRHSISGYLSDPLVATAIMNAVWA